MNETTPNFETQQQRWLKYGANVAMSIVVVIALAAMATYLAQRFARRIDTTMSGAYSLKPQTINLIKDNKQKIRLVSLYVNRNAKGDANQFAGPVNDLIEEYARKGSNIEAEVIDPITQPAMIDSLMGATIEKYGGAVQVYRDFLDQDFKKTIAQLNELIGTEAAALANLRTDAFGNDDRGQTMAAVVSTVREQQPQTLTRIKERTDRAVATKFPDYKLIVDRIKDASEDSLDRISQNEMAIMKIADEYKGDEAVPADLRKYLAGSVARHAKIKQIADETMKKIDGLGELKISALQQAMKDQNLILVMGESDWRVINFEQVWTADTRDLRAYTEGQELKPQFAGEQAVTTAILALTQGSKQKIAFVRAGGAPLASPGFPPFQRGGPFSEIADRLRGYNFDVVEKDVTGMWAMQAQMQGQPAAPEPSDKEIENAIWIVLDIPPDQRMPAPVNTLATKLAEHLKRGGAAMVLAMPQAPALAEVLKPLGVDLITDAIIVHEVPKMDTAAGAAMDLANEAQRLPFVFVMNRFGDHLLTRSVESLDALVAGASPVRVTQTAGIKATPLLPIPSTTKIWGERDIEGAYSVGNIKFDEGSDIPPPLFAGAAIESPAGSRIVIFGALQSFTNQIMAVPDRDMLARGVFVPRFPANSELFVDSVFWLAKMESMIEISPTAMNVPRIANMTDATLRNWQLFVLGGLPALVIAGGVKMYLKRRG